MGAHDSQPIVLVTGCPRSGTTALFRWLASSGRYRANDEPRMLRAVDRFYACLDLWRALNANRDFLEPRLRRLTFEYLSHISPPGDEPFLVKDHLFEAAVPIAKLFPQLKILYLIRDPVAVLNSMRLRKWGYSVKGVEPQAMPFEKGISWWNTCAEAERQLQLMKRAYTVRYETLLEDPARTSAGIAAYLGVDALGVFEPRVPAPNRLTNAEVARVRADTASARVRYGYV